MAIKIIWSPKKAIIECLCAVLEAEKLSSYVPSVFSMVDIRS